MMWLQNLSKLLDDPRKRSVILVTFLLLLTMVFVGGIRLFHQVRNSRLPSSAKIESMQLMRSVPGGVKKPSQQAYAKLQMEYNKKKAEEAKKTGRTALATMVDSFSLEEKESLKGGKGKGNLPILMSEAEQTIANHQAFMAQQQTELNKQQVQGAMHQQMNQLLSTWSRAPVSAYEESTLDASQFEKPQRDAQGNRVPPLVKAGTILHAVLLTEVNSDEPSPILAQITTGDFKEGRLIGELSRVGERLLIKFHTLNLPTGSRTLSIQALGVDEATARTSLASTVDRHTLLRYGSLFAAVFLKSAGTVAQYQAARDLYSDRKPARSAANAYLAGPTMSAVGNMGSELGSELGQQIHIPPTVCVNAGSAVGILFVQDLADPAYAKV